LKALKSGFQTHVTKPIEPAELTAIVSSLIRSYGRSRQRPTTESRDS
jgi:DNA-binding response OmpR family regulator